MPDAGAVETYRAALRFAGQPITLTRVIGVAPNATTASATVHAVARGYLPDTSSVSRTGFSENKLGAITQGQRHLIVSAADLEAEGFPLPVQKNDKVVIAGETLNVEYVDANKREFAAAIELTVTGV